MKKKANKLLNDILRKHGFLPQDAGDLDMWFGPRIFRNDSRFLELFTEKYEFQKRELELDKIVKPEQWANATFFPVIAAMREGYRVKSVPVNYVHPGLQTAFERDNEEFRRKRDVQLKNIITAVIHYIRSLEQNPKSRLRKVQDGH